jgi:dienelactone hydrolase
MKVETIAYSTGTTTFRGALVYDETVAKRRPAVLVAPNWMGVTDAAIDRGRLVAGDRYAVLVVDMYGENVRPKDFAEAATLANPLRADPQEQRRRMQAAHDALEREAGSRGLIDDKRAAVGFCFGGGNALELARAGAPLHAAVSVHGDLITEAPAQPGAVKAALLALHGSIDSVVPKAHRDRFEEEMTAAGASWQMLTFSGILHAYTDVGADVPGVAKYHEPTARQSYALMHAFLADAFAGRL